MAVSMVLFETFRIRSKASSFRYPRRKNFNYFDPASVDRFALPLTETGHRENIRFDFAVEIPATFDEIPVSREPDVSRIIRSARFFRLRLLRHRRISLSAKSGGAPVSLVLRNRSFATPEFDVRIDYRQTRFY